MNGDYDEGIRVYVLKEKDGILDLRFKDTKNYGDMWKSGVVDLSKDTDKFRLVFEGKCNEQNPKHVTSLKNENPFF